MLHVCDLCGSSEWTVLFESERDRSLLSNRSVLNRKLRKIECSECGLVRSLPGAHHDIQSFYANEYATEIGDHVFYTDDGSVTRSHLFADWICETAGENEIANARNVLEIGAGGGFLLEELSHRFPGTTFEGIELGKLAVKSATQRGLAVRNSALESWRGGPYDLIYSVAVLEHVVSPTNFLNKTRSLLRPGGLLILSQPIQDVESYDLLFADHMYHFASDHICAYAEKTGFSVRTAVIGHQMMPNFGMHVLAAQPGSEATALTCEMCTTSCRSTAVRLTRDFERLNWRLEESARTNTPLAAFGLQEAFWVARVYSALYDFPLACGIDDQSEKAEYCQFNFPVMRPAEAAKEGIAHALLTMNKVYYDQAEARLESLGIRPYRVFE